MTIVKSKITTVTVFNDRALITRSANNKLEKGNYSLIFDNLPSKIQENSIQVNGFGNATIMNVASKSVNYLKTSKEEIKKLVDKKNKLLDNIEQLTDNISEVDSERTFVQKIADKLTGDTKQTENNVSMLLEPDKWQHILKYYRQKQSEFNADNRKLKKKLDTNSKELVLIEKELSTLNQNQYKTGYQVEVKIEMQEAGELNLELTYIVFGPKWKPVYDIRVDSQTKTVRILYKALITQNSTEKWENTKIILSTAQPQISATQKKLTPIFVDLKSVQPGGVSGMSDKKNRSLSSETIMAEGGMSLGVTDSNLMKRKKVKKKVAIVEGNKISAVFKIIDSYNITNNNQPNEVTILIKEFNAKLFYSTTPKLEQYAFLKAEIKNNTDYLFLQGVSNIFLDNSFVANSNINLIAPNEKFIITLEVDQNIKVKYLFINKFHKNEGIVNKKTKIHYSYKIIITSNKKQDETIFVQDQIPISNHNDIKVELIKPSLSSKEDKFRKKEHEILKWTFVIKPKETKEIPLHYTIEYPKNDNIYYK